MTPEPTPVAGMMPRSVFASPEVVICTTAGLTLAATSMVADDSSIVTGCAEPTVWPVELDATGVGWSSEPVACSAMTVPPEASTAARRADATIMQAPPREPVVWVGVGGATVAVPIAGAGSYQRSGVG